MATYWENSCSFGLRYVSWYKYLIVSLVFSHLGFWSGNLFLIAPFPDLCLIVPFYTSIKINKNKIHSYNNLETSGSSKMYIVVLVVSVLFIKSVLYVSTCHFKFIFPT